jgi:hypothetical protein
LYNSSKESERDMFDQKNKKFSTVVVAATLMFSSLTTVIFQGFLPENCDKRITIAYAVTSSVSFAFLFLSTVLATEIISTSSHFMYKRTATYQKNIRKAIERSLSSSNPTASESMSIGAQSPSSSKSSAYNGLRAPPVVINEDNVDNEVDRHENQSYINLKRRETIIREASSSINIESFEDFWERACGKWSLLSMVFFYGGSANLIFSIAIYMWATFGIKYNSFIGGILSVSIISTGVAIGFGVVVVVRHYCDVADKREEAGYDASEQEYFLGEEHEPSQTSPSTTPNSRDTNNNAGRKMDRLGLGLSVNTTLGGELV